MRARIETNASATLKRLGQGGKDAPKEMLFGHGTQTVHDIQRSRQTQEVQGSHTNSSKMYKHLQPIVVKILASYTDLKGNWKSAQDLPRNYFEDSRMQLLEES